MIGDIKIMDGVYYFQINNKGTLEKLPKVTLWGRFLIELRDCIKKWEYSEIKIFCNKHIKRKKIKGIYPDFWIY